MALADDIGGQSGTLARQVRGLIDQQSESRSLDYKAAMPFGPDKKSKAEMVKCLMAFSNTTDGGHILVGVAEVGGRYQLTGLQDGDLATWDKTPIGDFARRYCSALPRFELYKVELDNLRVVLIEVLPFDEEPLICTRHLDFEGTKVLRAAAIYHRSDDAKCVEIESAGEMRRLLQLGVQRQGETLLRQIAAITGARVAGPPPEAGLYAQELQSAQAFVEGHDVFGPHWQLVIRPTVFRPDRLTIREVEDHRSSGVVHIRGWDIPHVDHEHADRFENGVQSWTNWTQYTEAHRAFRSGLFFWRRLYWEDMREEVPDEARPALEYVSAIWSITEQLLFAARWAYDISPDEQFALSWEATGLEGRSLWVAPGSAIQLSMNYRSGAEACRQVFELSAGELKTDWQNIAVTSAQSLFELFNFDVGPNTIRGWQERFLNRQF